MGIVFILGGSIFYVYCKSVEASNAPPRIPSMIIEAPRPNIPAGITPGVQYNPIFVEGDEKKARLN